MPMMESDQSISLSSTGSARPQNSFTKPRMAKISWRGEIRMLRLMAETAMSSTGLSSDEMAVARPAPATPIAGMPNAPKMDI